MKTNPCASQVYKGKDSNPAKVAVADLSLAIKQHECFGLLGPNGAGKTTVIKVSLCYMSWELLGHVVAAFWHPSLNTSMLAEILLNLLPNIAELMSLGYA